MKKIILVCLLIQAYSAAISHDYSLLRGLITFLSRGQFKIQILLGKLSFITLFCLIMLFSFQQQTFADSLKISSDGQAKSNSSLRIVPNLANLFKTSPYFALIPYGDQSHQIELPTNAPSDFINEFVSGFRPDQGERKDLIEAQLNLCQESSIDSCPVYPFMKELVSLVYLDETDDKIYLFIVANHIKEFSSDVDEKLVHFKIAADPDDKERLYRAVPMALVSKDTETYYKGSIEFVQVQPVSLSDSQIINRNNLVITLKYRWNPSNNEMLNKLKEQLRLSSSILL